MIDLIKKSKEGSEAKKKLLAKKWKPGKIIAMPQPLYGEDVEYQDGTNPTLEQEVIDVVTFLTWTAMPDLEQRRSAGVKVIFFLFRL